MEDEVLCLRRNRAEWELSVSQTGETQSVSRDLSPLPYYLEADLKFCQSVEEVSWQGRDWIHELVLTQKEPEEMVDISDRPPDEVVYDAVYRFHHKEPHYIQKERRFELKAKLEHQHHPNPHHVQARSQPAPHILLTQPDDVGTGSSNFRLA